MSRMPLRSMFSTIAEKYDLFNTVLTFGLDEVWRETCARECASGLVVVDLCCGTGRLSFRIAKHLKPESCIFGLDFNKTMLRRAREQKTIAGRKKLCVRKHNDLGIGTSDITFILADAAHLPFKDECVDRIGISFSLRNLIYKNLEAETHLREALRVLRQKGKFVCVETSQPSLGFLRTLFHLYCKKVVPLVGWLVSKHKSAYLYLGMSAANFPTGEEVVAMLLRAGFGKASFKHLTSGIVGFHVAVK